MIPDPLKDWFADQSKQAALIEALSSPIFREATALLNTISLPKPDLVERASAEAITYAAMEQKRNAGFFSYLDHLWQLTEPPKMPPKRPEGYSDSYVKAWAIRQGYFADGEQTEEQQATTNQ